MDRFEAYEKIISDIEKNGAFDIIEMAVKEYVRGFCGVVLFNINSEEYSAYCWSNNTRSGNSDDIEVYRLTDQDLEDEDRDEILEIINGDAETVDQIEKNILECLRFEM